MGQITALRRHDSSNCTNCSNASLQYCSEMLHLLMRRWNILNIKLVFLFFFKRLILHFMGFTLEKHLQTIVLNKIFRSITSLSTILPMWPTHVGHSQADFWCGVAALQVKASQARLNECWPVRDTGEGDSALLRSLNTCIMHDVHDAWRAACISSKSSAEEIQAY